MSLTTADEVYNQIVRSLPTLERLKLVEKIAHDLIRPPDHEVREAGEITDWLSASRSALQEVWDNDEDAAYDRL